MRHFLSSFFRSSSRGIDDDGRAIVSHEGVRRQTQLLIYRQEIPSDDAINLADTSPEARGLFTEHAHT